MSEEGVKFRPRRLRTRAAALVAAASVLGTSVVSDTSTAAWSSSSETFMYTGSAGSQPGKTVTLAKVPTHTDGAHLITADVVVEHLSDDPTHVVTISLGCRDKNGYEQRMSHYLNSLAIAPITRFEPHLVFHATDDFTCWVAARAMRILLGNGVEGPQPVLVRSAELRVEPTHYRARVTDVHDERDKTDMLGVSRLVRSGTNTVATSTRTLLPNPRRDVTLTVRSGLQLTSCTHVYGSSDQTTGGRHLCSEPGAAADHESGPIVYTQLFVRQMAEDGSVCRTVEVPGGRTYQRLSSLRHHAPRYSEGTLVLPASECGAEIRPFVRVHVNRGPSVVLHWPGSHVSVTLDSP